MIKRKQTRQISIGNVKIGGGAPISVQSMTNTKTTDTAATVAQIKALEKAGCDVTFHSLEEGVADYVRNYMMKDDPYLEQNL